MAATKTAERATKKAPRRAAKPAVKTPQAEYEYCAMPQVPDRIFGPEVDPQRASLIHLFGKKWVNGTVLHYYFFDQQSDGEHVFFADGSKQWRSWTAAEAQKDVVRRTFEVWKEVGIGLEFQEVDSREEAEIRIGFMQGDGSWSYVGRDIIDLVRDANQRTMNFGWDLTRHGGDIDTAIHEIGHTLGFPHEHQNPHAGIIWDDEAVYAALAAPPNNWSREVTYHNIIRKIPADTVGGSTWDPDSIMHYPFGPGLILQPEEYGRNGLRPAPGLSHKDKAWVKHFYPPIASHQYPELKPFEALPLALTAGQQKDLAITPSGTRYYNLGTFGESDTVMVLFEDDNGQLRYLTGEDDSGEEGNNRMHVKLFKGRRYVLRIRLYYTGTGGETAVMIW